MAVAASNPDLVKTDLWPVLWCGFNRRLEIVFQVRWALCRTAEKRDSSCLLLEATSMKTNPCVFTFYLDIGASSGYLGSNPGFLLTSCVTVGCFFSLELSWLGDLDLFVSNVFQGFPGGSVVKNLPTDAGVLVQSLGQEDALEEEMTTLSSILAWRNHMNRGAWQTTVHRVTKQLDMTEQLNHNNDKRCLLVIWFSVTSLVVSAIWYTAENWKVKKKMIGGCRYCRFCAIVCPL